MQFINPTVSIYSKILSGAHCLLQMNSSNLEPFCHQIIYEKDTRTFYSPDPDKCVLSKPQMEYRWQFLLSD